MSTDAAQPESSPPASPQPAKKRGCFKFLLFGGLVLVGLVAAVPTLVSKFGAGPLQDALSEQLDADVTIESFGFGWGGTAHLEGLRIVDKQGFEHMALQRFEGSIAPFAAVRGSYEVEGKVVGLKMHADQAEDGAWSFSRLFPTTSPSEEAAPEEGEAAEVGAPPALDAKLSMEGTEILVTTPKGNRQVAVTSGRLLIPALDELSRLDVNGQITGDGDLAEPLRVQGDLVLWAALDPEGMDQPLAELETWIGGSVDGVPGSEAFSMTSVIDLRQGWQGSQLELEADMAAMGEMIAPFLWEWAPDAGRMELGATLGSEETGSTFTMRMIDARATTKMAPALAYAHPAFAGLEQVKGAQLAGGLGFELNFQVPGAANVQEWMENPPIDQLAGGGSLSLSGLSLSGAQVLDQLYGLLGVTDKKLDLSTLQFSLDAGRLVYDKPWAWNMLGSPTTFGGAVGLDGELDLVWKLPITEAMGEKTSLLKSAVGRTLELPLGGQMASPKMPWGKAIEDLAKSAIEDRARQELTDKVGSEVGDKIDDLLQDKGLGKVDELLQDKGLGKVTDLLGQGGLKLPKNGEQAAKMLMEEADKLWNAGKRSEAAPLYAKIRSDYKLTTVYAFNRSKIKSRKDG